MKLYLGLIYFVNLFIFQTMCLWRFPAVQNTLHPSSSRWWLLKGPWHGAAATVAASEGAWRFSEVFLCGNAFLVICSCIYDVL